LQSNIRDSYLNLNLVSYRGESCIINYYRNNDHGINLTQLVS